MHLIAPEDKMPFANAPSEKNALVSIIMPAHNSEKTIRESIGSVLQQSFSDWELLIIDDMSDDSTPTVVTEFVACDSRIKLIALPQNRGVANARNIGIQKARGRYIAFLDSDDFWLPEKLRTQIEFMLAYSAHFSFTAYRSIDQKGRLGSLIQVPTTISYRQLLKGNVIGCLTVMIDTAFVGRVSFPPLERAEDFALWMSLLKAGRLGFGIQEDLARYRLSSGSLTGNKFHTIATTWNVYRNVEAMSAAKAAWYFLHQCATAASRHMRNSITRSTSVA